MSNENEYVEIYSFGSGGLVKKLATVDNKEIPDTYFGFKSTTSSEILYVSFDTVPYNADDVFVASNITNEHNITASYITKKLLREGETSNFTKISDSSFSINIVGEGTITYEKIPNTQFLYQSEVPVEEANKEVSINVKNYTTPIEITPTSGSDVMDKVTVTLTNIPNTLYVWTDGNKATDHMYTKFSDVSECTGEAWQTSTTKNSLLVKKSVEVSGNGLYVTGYSSNVYYRDPENDFVI